MLLYKNNSSNANVISVRTKYGEKERKRVVIGGVKRECMKSSLGYFVVRFCFCMEVCLLWYLHEIR